jgi:TRAP-type C4-dicarboxylate transport system permease small subunit
MEAVKKALAGMVFVIQVLLICLIAGIVLLMLNEIVLRNFFNKSFRGMTEVAGLLFMWMAFLGIAVLYDKNRLITLDIFSSRVSGAGKTVLVVVHNIIALALGTIMVAAFAGLYPYASTEHFSSMPEISKLWNYIPLAIAGGFMAIKSLYNLINLRTASELKS